jgi:hypothetical protein
MYVHMYVTGWLKKMLGLLVDSNKNIIGIIPHSQSTPSAKQGSKHKKVLLAPRFPYTWGAVACFCIFFGPHLHFNSTAGTVFMNILSYLCLLVFLYGIHLVMRICNFMEICTVWDVTSCSLQTFLWNGSHDSSVGIATRLRAERQRNWGSISDREKRFFCSTHCPHRLAGPRASYKMGTGGCFPGDKGTWAWGWPFTSNCCRV